MGISILINRYSPISQGNGAYDVVGQAYEERGLICLCLHLIRLVLAMLRKYGEHPEQKSANDNYSLKISIPDELQGCDCDARWGCIACRYFICWDKSDGLSLAG